MYNYKATVSRVVDGDTVDLVIDHGMKLYSNQRIRVAGINAPEQKMADGKVATKRMTELLPVGDIVEITTQKSDLYGRYLAVIINSAGVNVGQTMLNEGLAVVYKRKRKAK
jgi:micrococcal nuclease